MYYGKNNLNLFKSFFKGREDVFAVRWEKEKQKRIYARLFL